MKKFLKYAAVTAIATAALSSCSADNDMPDITGEGTVFLSASLNTDVKPASRATVDEMRESAIIWISNEKGVVRQFKGIGDVPAEGVKLLSGNYVAEAWAGDSVPASWDQRYFKGAQDFTIAKGDKKSVEITCKIANSVVNVVYDENFDEALSGYTLTVGHSQGELVYEGRTDAKGYFMMNSRDKDLVWTLTGTLPDGNSYVRSGRIKDCRPATLYTLNVKCSTREDDEIGGAYFTVEVDETEAEVEDVIQITAAPEVNGYNFDLSTTIRGKRGTIGRRSLWITSSTALKGVVISSDYLAEKFGLVGNSFDLLQMTDEDLRSRIEAAGINFDTAYDAEKDAATMKLNFEERLTNELTDGTYEFAVQAIDANGKTGTGTLRIIVSDVPVTTSAVNAADVWTTRATVRGELNKADATGAVMRYRKAGASEWIDAETTVEGSRMYAELTGLEAATTYEYAASAEDFTADILTFTTESMSQLPNSGFEDWSIYKDKIWMPSLSETDSYWDCGNSALKGMLFIANLAKNPTSKDETMKHGGNASARLRSTSTAGVLAAGNIFVGEFIRTDGTNGVLGWGRPWTDRPTKLKGFARYEPQAVTSEKEDYPDLKKGDMDKGIIYIALLDNSNSETDSGKSYPVIVRTNKKNRQLFNKNAANVIAYGELVFDGATAGSGLEEFEITLTYNRTDVKPSYIMCTASASIGGDYFVGGEGSTLWLDDLELVY